MPLRELATRLRDDNPDFHFTSSTYYIPESWYVQQLVEGGWMALVLFVALCVMILVRVARYRYMLGGVVAILSMNIFLHSFESVHSALALMTFLAFFLPVKPTTIVMTHISKYLLAIPIFLLPWHALLMTFLQCKIHLDTTLMRFWKEACVLGGIVWAGVALWKRKGRLVIPHASLIGTVVVFILSSLIYVIVPDGALTSRDIL